MQPVADALGDDGIALVDYTIDPNYAAETAIARLLGMVPTVGSILSALVYIFWPTSKEDIWGQIEAKVEQLIQQDLSVLVRNQVGASLTGLNNNLNSYLLALRTGGGTPGYISSQWIVANGMFLQQLPTFQLSGYQLLLLPLFAQFANMHLSLLRDGVAFGASWGWTPEIVAQQRADLTTAIAAYQAYTQSTYAAGLVTVQAAAPVDDHAAQPFRTVNTFVRQMTLTVLDYSILWPYFDITTYPNGANVARPREIYSDPQGTCDNSGPIVIPSAPTQPVQQISVWGWDRIDGVQLTYPAGGGPNGATTTPRMGDQGGGSNGAPHGGVFQVAGNPVVTVSGSSGDIVNGMAFTFADGSGSGLLGGNYPGGGGYSWSFPGQILSSIYINGISSFYGSADCVVFGFRFTAPQPVNPSLRALLYLTAPVLTAEMTADAAADPQARDVYWNSVAARAAA